MEITKEQLVSWHKNQRQSYKLGTLPEDKIKKMEMIPGWKWGTPNTSNDKKKILLEMAERKESKPDKSSVLGTALRHYTYSSHESYDIVFSEQIKKVNPEWLTNKTIKKKRSLLEIAERKESKPPKNTVLGRALRSYTNIKKTCYDSVFTEQIRNLSPEWFEFINPSIEKKKLLLEMGKNKENKPVKNSVLGRALRDYVDSSENSYDPIFDEQIRKVSPEWFDFTNTTIEKKNLLIEIAKKNEVKPPKKSNLGKVLRNYTYFSNSCYDPTFDKEIRTIAPQWFNATG